MFSAIKLPKLQKYHYHKNMSHIFCGIWWRSLGILAWNISSKVGQLLLIRFSVERFFRFFFICVHCLMTHHTQRISQRMRPNNTRGRKKPSMSNSRHLPGSRSNLRSLNRISEQKDTHGSSCALSKWTYKSCWQIIHETAILRTSTFAFRIENESYLNCTHLVALQSHSVHKHNVNLFQCNVLIYRRTEWNSSYRTKGMIFCCLDANKKTCDRPSHNK